MSDEIVRLIPNGWYCYSTVNTMNRCRVEGICPYWSTNDKYHHQENGYCSYLGRGDWEVEHMSLLWDMVKECGENYDFDPEEEPLNPTDSTKSNLDI